MNKSHYSEADLLETYYMRPGESMPVMMHLAGCTDCAARYERLDAKLRAIATCDTEQPDTFWARQRHGVMRRIAGVRQSRTGAGTLRVAAAATLAFVLGGVVFYQRQPVNETHMQTTITASAAAAPTVEATSTIPEDPWQSEELKEYEPIVAWESWVEPADLAKRGGHS